MFWRARQGYAGARNELIRGFKPLSSPPVELSDRYILQICTLLRKERGTGNATVFSQKGLGNQGRYSKDRGCAQRYQQPNDGTVVSTTKCGGLKRGIHLHVSAHLTSSKYHFWIESCTSIHESADRIVADMEEGLASLSGNAVLSANVYLSTCGHRMESRPSFSPIFEDSQLSTLSIDMGAEMISSSIITAKQRVLRGD